MFLTLPEIKAKVNQLAEKIDVPQEILPTYGYSKGTGHPHIDISSQGYYYLALERDVVCDRLITKDIDELLYKIFVDVTFVLSTEYELNHRVENQDSRRILFQHQVELLSMLSPQGGERKSREHEQILAQHPFDDFALDRANHCRNLRGQGYSPEIAEKMAYEKYPLQKDL